MRENGNSCGTVSANLRSPDYNPTRFPGVILDFVFFLGWGRDVEVRIKAERKNRFTALGMNLCLILKNKGFNFSAAAKESKRKTKKKNLMRDEWND